ncbi:hypothetical protein TgHK011_005534 [Trichoderma gracile]|nr:hypothetical protein TgHK011_005534 [Trichoderma gracile]
MASGQFSHQFPLFCPASPSPDTLPTMCDWEEFLFTCNHSQVRLKSYCHFARNDPHHGCPGVKVLRSSWRQAVPCDDCLLKGYPVGVLHRDIQ